MNSTLLDRLLGLSRLSWSDPGSHLGWRYELDPWAWVLVVLAAVLVASFSYKRLIGARSARVLLAAFRALIVLLVAALLAGPLLVLPQEQTEPDWLVFLVDRSASMTLQDVVRPSGRISRDAQLREGLQQHRDLFTKESGLAGNDRQLLWLGFDAGTFTIHPPHVDPGSLGEPRGRPTRLRTALEQALQRAAGRPISGIVLFSDGRSGEVMGNDLVRRLRQHAVSVFPVPLGEAIGPVDLSLGRVDAPERALVQDVVPVSVWVERSPPDAPVDPADVTVRLVDVATGEVLDEQTPANGDLGGPLHLVARSAHRGGATWRLELVYDPPTGGEPAELITENNARVLHIEFVDRPIRVLYVEGHPRWEYRYLKNLLIREKRIKSSILLIEADAEFAQEGDEPIARLPVNRTEMQPYDVILIGDVPPGYWGHDHVTLIRDHVAQRGAGLLWIAGPNDTPRSYDRSPLAGLLPMRHPGTVQRVDPVRGPLVVRPTGLARMMHVLQLRGQTPGAAEEQWPKDQSPKAQWPESLPPLLWALDTGPLKPTAEVLAEALGSSGEGTLTVPLLVSMRYGAGQSLFVATDETWRWRYGRGDLFFDQFWVQLVQLLGRGRLQQSSGRRAWLEVSHRKVGLGQAVVVEVSIQDRLLLNRDLSRIAVGVFEAADPDAGQLDRVELVPVGPGDRGPASEEAEEPTVFRAVWRPTVAGDLVLRVIEPALADLGIVQRLEVTRPDDEMLDPSADHERLRALAARTGGQVVSIEDLDDLAAVVPNRSRKTPADQSEPLWNSPLALLLVVGLLTVEWIGRKLIRLV